MKWLCELIGIPSDNQLDISVPKEKLVSNLKSRFTKMAALREFDNIEDIVYHTILRRRLAGKLVDELHVVEVKLHEPKYVKIIAEAFQAAIPYSQIIVFSSMGKYLLFTSHSQNKPIRSYQFSDWVYEEELMIDFLLGIQRQSENTIVENDWNSWMELLTRLDKLFYSASSNSYLCLRHLIDILRIREVQSGAELIWPIISSLVLCGKIEYFEDLPFITWSDATSAYLEAKPHLSVFSSIEDDRFGIDRQFERLTCFDFVSSGDTVDLLEEIERSVLYSEYASEDYDDGRYYGNSDEEYYDDYG